jgi:diacylglycerol kinase (ATP)
MHLCTGLKAKERGGMPGPVERFTQASFRKLPEGLESAPGLGQKYLIVVNPVSRGGRATKEGAWLIRRLARLGVWHEAFFTDYAGHAESIVESLVDQVDVVVAVGGDGTINEVINGMMASSGRGKTLAVFPAGTADDFCHNVGIPRDRRKALEAMLGDGAKRIDLIRHNDRYAAVTLGVGVDAEIAYHTLSHKRIRIPAYFAVGMRIVFKERMRKSPRLMRIVTDEGEVFEDRYLIAVFGNAPLYARYVYFMPNAIMDDGLLNMSVLRPMPPIPAWYLLMRSFSRGYKTDKVLRVASKSFSVELKEDSYLQVDGEVYKYQAGQKIDISVAGRVLNVRVPGKMPENAGLLTE